MRWCAIDRACDPERQTRRPVAPRLSTEMSAVHLSQGVGFPIRRVPTKISNGIRMTVSFVCYRNQITGELVPVSSAFYLGDPVDDGGYCPRRYGVTARPCWTRSPESTSLGLAETKLTS